MYVTIACAFVTVYKANESTFELAKRNDKIIVMKRIKYLAALFAIMVGAYLLTACSGYIVATAPPVYPTEVIVVAPSPRHVWVPGYYTYTRGNYVFVYGYYSVPPRGKTVYIQGQWQKTPKGYKRGRGHWN